MLRSGLPEIVQTTWAVMQTNGSTLSPVNSSDYQCSTGLTGMTVTFTFTPSTDPFPIEIEFLVSLSYGGLQSAWIASGSTLTIVVSASGLSNLFQVVRVDGRGQSANPGENAQFQLKQVRNTYASFNSIRSLEILFRKQFWIIYKLNG